MNKAFELFTWKDSPSKETPLGARLLQKLNAATNEIDDRVIALDTEKISQTDIASLISNWSIDDKGIITVTRVDGSVETNNTGLSKVNVDCRYDKDTQQFYVIAKDGTETPVDLSSLISQYEFLDSDTIAHAISDGKVSAIVKEGSIEDKHLKPGYLAEIKVETANSKANAESAAKSAESASASEISAKESAESATSEANRAWEAAAITVPEFYIDFETGCLMSKTEAKGMEFRIGDGYFYGEVVA